jgi:DNA-binding transcriptional LysR family regulator
MNLTLDALAVIDAIDRRGSFAAAAEELGRVPSAITYTVRRLEDTLDALLFDRSRRRARLTAAGRELLDQGRLLLAQAGSIEQRVRSVANGWEAELRIGVDAIVPMPIVWPLAARFFDDCRERRSAHTRLRFSAEVLGGSWDALADGRADFLIGATGDPPPGGGFRTRLLAETPMVFAVAPSHPLADAPEPLGEATLAQHRIVVAADSSRRLPARTVGWLSGQDTLTVPDLVSKREAQLAGLGCGTLPWHAIADDVRMGRLLPKAVENPQRPARVQAAWRTGRPGNALAWWIDAVASHDWRFLALGPIEAAPVRGRARTAKR